MTTATTQTISDEWRETTLEKCVSVLGDGLHGTPKYSERGEYHFINGNNLVDGKIKLKDDTKRTSVDEYEKYKKPLNKRTLFVSINGTLGSVGAYNNEKVFLGKSVCYFNVLEDVSKTFIKYTLTGRHFQKYISITANGTTIKNVPLSAMRAYSFNLPPLPEQKAIADVLSSFDDKIELLREQNKTLEAMAQALFKHWFVDFEFPNEDGKPYKSSGGKMVDSDLGEMPDGWSVKQISDFGKVVCGKTPLTSHAEYYDGDTPFIKIPDMHNQMFTVNTSTTLSDEGVETQSQKTLPPYSICVSCIATVGLVSLTSEASQTNQQINSIIPDKDIYTEYLFLKLRNMYKFLNDLGGGGSATLNMNTGIFSAIDVLMPTKEILSLFSDTAKPNFEKILQNNLQVQTLTETRETLLPKLMRGDVRVKI